MTTMIADQKQDAPAPADSTTVDQTGTEAPVCTPPVLASTQAAGDALNDLTRDQERLLRRGGELDRTIPRLEREEQEAGAEAKAIDRGTPPGRKEAVEKRVAATRRELENARQEREAIKEGLSSLTTQIRDTEATAKQLIEACNDPKAVDRHAAGIRKDLARKQKALAKCEKLRDQLETKVATAETDFTAAIDNGDDVKIEAAQNELAKHSAARSSVLDQIARREDEVQGTKARLELAEEQVKLVGQLTRARQQRKAFEDLRRQEAELVAQLAVLSDSIEEASREGERLNVVIGASYQKLRAPGFAGMANNQPRPAREAGTQKTCPSQVTYKLHVDRRTLTPAESVTD